MKRLLFVLLLCSLPALAQSGGPGGPSGTGCKNNCTFAGTTTATGTLSVTGLSTLSGGALVGLGTPNDTTTGTVLYSCAKHLLTAGVDTLIECGTSDTQVAGYPVISGAGKSGNAYTQQSGTLAVPSDNSLVAGDCVVVSTTTVGAYHDTGSTSCGSSWGLGYATTSGASPQSVLITGVQPNTHVITFNLVKSGAVGVFPVVDFACTIYRVDVTADQSGTFAMDVWKANAAIPTGAGGQKISGTSWTPLSAAQSSFNTSLSGWTSSGAIAVSPGDVFGGTVPTFTTVTNVTVQIRCH